MIHLAATKHFVLDVLSGEISMKCGCECPLGCHSFGHIACGPDNPEHAIDEVMKEFKQIKRWDRKRLTKPKRRRRRK